MNDLKRPWPASARRVASIHLRHAPETATVDLTMNRLNRSTGYTDPTSLGLMDVEDFRAFAAHVAYVLREINGEVTLVEKLCGLRPT